MSGSATGRPPAPAAGPPGAPTQQVSASKAEAVAPAPPGRPQRRRAPTGLPETPPSAGPTTAARGRELDFPGRSRCRSPDALGQSPRVPAHAHDRSEPSYQRARPAAAGDESQQLLTKEAAADRLSVSARQLSRFVANGLLKPVRLGPRLVRFTSAELAAFVERCAADAKPSPWPERPRRRTR